MNRNVRIPVLVVAGLVAAVLLVSGGVMLGLNSDVRDAVRGFLPGVVTGSGADVDLDLQKEVLQKLESSYYKEVDPAVLKADAIDGMVAGLDDPYTVYMDPEEYASFQEHTSGSYSGVGMTVEMNDRLVTIVSTFKGTPAQSAGIRPGDLILAVDGLSTEGQNLDEVVGRIKGPEGTTVTLSIYRPLSPTTSTTVAAGDGGTDDGAGTAGPTGEEPEGADTADVSQLPPGGETIEFTLTRKTIAIPVAESEMLEAEGKKVGLVRFFTFSEGSGSALRAEVVELLDQGASAIILDLRSNGGGLLNEAIEVASIFLRGGVIVTTEGLHSPEQVYEALGGDVVDAPLYVLTDPYTASASEIVAGALQDYGRATLVGDTTFGKGLVQSIESLSNGGAMKVTTAVYFTPDGRDINTTGIAPDLVAPDDFETPTVDEGLEAVLDLIGSGQVVD